MSETGLKEWDFACEAPCDTWLPWGRDYRAVGDGKRPTHAFALDAPPGRRVAISVDTVSVEGHVYAMGLVVLGTVVAVGGLVVASVAFAPVSCSDPSCSGDGGARWAGSITALAGIGLVVGGIVLMSSTMFSRQKQVISEFMLPFAPSRPDTAWLRAPVWRDSGASDAPAPRASVPVFSRNF
jgi:hypothetical protein